MCSDSGGRKVKFSKLSMRRPERAAKEVNILQNIVIKPPSILQKLLEGPEVIDLCTPVDLRPQISSTQELRDSVSEFLNFPSGTDLSPETDQVTQTIDLDYILRDVAGTGDLNGSFLDELDLMLQGHQEIPSQVGSVAGNQEPPPQVGSEAAISIHLENDRGSAVPPSLPPPTPEPQADIFDDGLDFSVENILYYQNVKRQMDEEDVIISQIEAKLALHKRKRAALESMLI